MNMSDTGALLNKVGASSLPEPGDIERLLAVQGEDGIREIFVFADKVRKDFCGDGIILRGIIEFSSFCTRECFYCGLNKGNVVLKRYRMKKPELFEAVRFLAESNVKTVVLQSGDDANLDPSWMRDVISGIKSNFDIAVTLSIGERNAGDYRLWRQAGADRFLLKMETTDEALYSSMHPRMDFKRRLRCLYTLKDLGYQVGSGNIVGLPGQTLSSIARDIVFFRKMELDMIGIGPFIPHKDSRFADQSPGDPVLTLKTIALTRIANKLAHIPATTALGSLDKDYRLDGLKCGANVLMPNFTPSCYRRLYEIYPHKRCIDEPVGGCGICMDDAARSLGRFIDYSRGDSLKKKGVVTNV